MAKNNHHQRRDQRWENSSGFVDLKRQLAILKENRRKIKSDHDLYYDQDLDELDIKEYYRGAEDLDFTGLAMFYKFHTLVVTSHLHQIPYFISKDLYLYTWVDLYPDGSAKSIYSSGKKDPEQLIIQDHEIIKKKYEQFKQNSNNVHLNGFDSLKELKGFEAKYKMNTEHIVPQSWFEGSEPMKGDLHHLFVCNPECNIARANFPYTDFDFYTPESKDEPLMNDCGISIGFKFEPEHGKGACARAMLYFFLRYPKRIKKEFLNQVNVPLLKRWTNEFKPSLYEKHRNQAIYYIQGNRNPFIDFPELVEKIDFPL
jgi:deoxyribonuclease I